MISLNSDFTSSRLGSATAAFDKLINRKDLGFLQIPDRGYLFDEVEKIFEHIKPGVKKMMLVGIGGSSLGPKALQEIYRRPENPRCIYFCDNVDGVEFSRLLDFVLDPEEWIFVFISKSGSTLETLISLESLLQWGEVNSINLAKQAVVISELKSNPLTDWARKNDCPILEIPEDVGGRFSVLTAVGCLPLRFLGGSVENMQRGARKALAEKELVCKMVAAAMDSFDRGLWISFFWFYSSQLKTFGLWLEQLWAESLAKKIDRQNRTGPRVSTPISAIGAVDQHSLLQQLMEGANDKWIVFIRNKQAERGPFALRAAKLPVNKYLEGKSIGEVLAAEASATRQALSTAGLFTSEMTVENLDEETLGFFIMYWQLVVGTLGEALDINAFDQPGVEIGKKLAKGLLQS